MRVSLPLCFFPISIHTYIHTFCPSKSFAVLIELSLVAQQYQNSDCSKPTKEKRLKMCRADDITVMTDDCGGLSGRAPQIDLCRHCLTLARNWLQGRRVARPTTIILRCNGSPESGAVFPTSRLLRWGHRRLEKATRDWQAAPNATIQLEAVLKELRKEIKSILKQENELRSRIDAVAMFRIHMRPTLGVRNMFIVTERDNVCADRTAALRPAAPNSIGIADGTYSPAGRSVFDTVGDLLVGAHSGAPCDRPLHSA